MAAGLPMWYRSIRPAHFQRHIDPRGPRPFLERVRHEKPIRSVVYTAFARRPAGFRRPAVSLRRRQSRQQRVCPRSAPGHLRQGAIAPASATIAGCRRNSRRAACVLIAHVQPSPHYPQSGPSCLRSPSTARWRGHGHPVRRTYRIDRTQRRGQVLAAAAAGRTHATR